VATTVVASPEYLIENVRRRLTARRRAVGEFADAADMNTVAMRLLTGMRRSGRPAFLFVNYMDAHWPYAPPGPFCRRFPGRDDRFTGVRYDGVRDALNEGQTDPAVRAREHLVSQYDGSIAYLDDQVGHLIGWLKTTGAYDDTMLIVTSDHGEAFGE